MNPSFTEREQVVETVNRLFYYTDTQNWDQLIQEVFASEVLLDMTSLGAAEATRLTSQQICDAWKEGFQEPDAVYHQSGNHLVDLKKDEALVTSYAIASHYKKAAKNGNVQEFVGSYDFHLVKESGQWKLDEFTFHLKYMAGNLELT